MPTTYEPASEHDPGILETMQRVLDDRPEFEPLSRSGLRIEVLCVLNDAGSPIKVLGLRALAKVKVIGAEERSRGGPDVRIVLYSRSYDRLAPRAQEAILARCLYSLVVTETAIDFKRDAYDRPVVKVRRYDWVATGFEDVASWYGEHSLEHRGFAALSERLGQLRLPFGPETPISAAVGPDVTLTVNRQPVETVGELAQAIGADQVSETVDSPAPKKPGKRRRCSECGHVRSGKPKCPACGCETWDMVAAQVHPSPTPLVAHDPQAWRSRPIDEMGLADDLVALARDWSLETAGTLDEWLASDDSDDLPDHTRDAYIEALDAISKPHRECMRCAFVRADGKECPRCTSTEWDATAEPPDQLDEKTKEAVQRAAEHSDLDIYPDGPRQQSPPGHLRVGGKDVPVRGKVVEDEKPKRKGRKGAKAEALPDNLFLVGPPRKPPVWAVRAESLRQATEFARLEHPKGARISVRPLEEGEKLVVPILKDLTGANGVAAQA